jgi:hypothetical protein
VAIDLGESLSSFSFDPREPVLETRSNDYNRAKCVGEYGFQECMLLSEILEMVEAFVFGGVEMSDGLLVGLGLAEHILHLLLQALHLQAQLLDALVFPGMPPLHGLYAILQAVDGLASLLVVLHQPPQPLPALPLLALVALQAFVQRRAQLSLLLQLPAAVRIAFQAQPGQLLSLAAGVEGSR